MKQLSKNLNKLITKKDSDRPQYQENGKALSQRAKTGGGMSERKHKDWREWWTIKKARNEELIKNVEKNNVHTVRDLLNRSTHGDLVADVNTLGLNEMTALHLACKLGQMELAKVLLDAEADLECRNKAGKTPLHQACQYNRHAILRVLLSHNSNQLARDLNDNTPLHLAAEMGQSESCRYLLERFGYKQLRSRNKMGKLPHELADQKLAVLFKEVQPTLDKMPVYEIKDETVKKMFAAKYARNEEPKSEQQQNLDKRIHKILDQIRAKKEPQPASHYMKAETSGTDSARQRTSSNDSDNRSTRSIEQEKQGVNQSQTSQRQFVDRSTLDTLNPHRTDSLKYTNPSTPGSQKRTDVSYGGNTSSSPAITSKSREDRDSSDNKPIAERLKNKRNIINCISKEEVREGERPYSAPVKRQVSNTDRSGREQSDYQKLLKEQQAKKKDEGNSTPRGAKVGEKPKDTISSLKPQANSIEVERTSDSDFGGPKKGSPEDFVAHTVLGKGSFGEVYLVQKKDQEGFYAMKILRKAKIMGRNLTRQAKTERNILTQVKHPFIVELFQAFQTSEKLFLIMEQCPCGDLGQILHKLKKFDENTAKFQIAEILLALEHLHAHNIIQRDLKPDNVVLDRQGHAKLTDFGLSKEDIDDETSTSSFCGSVAYLAPEMLNKSGHGKSVDWYLLGVLLQEMLNGIPPQFDQDREKMFDKIKSHKLKQHASLSSASVDLLKQLLERNPSRRLGTVGDGEEIRKHAFFDGIDWDQVRSKKYKPPLMINKKVNLNKNPVEVTNKEPHNKANYVEGWSFVNPSVEE